MTMDVKKKSNVNLPHYLVYDCKKANAPSQWVKVNPSNVKDCLKMADDSDVPPLEDMTEIVKKADVIRESRNGPAKQNGSSNPSAKERAKVVKKPAAQVVTPNSELAKGDVSSKKPQEVKSTKQASATNPPDTGMFGGMKKGFLFGGPTKSNKTISSSLKSSSDSIKKSKENIPFITPKEKTQSALTFDEVQQAMSEAKGLMDNQDWITDDLLTKIEKNGTLRKKFADAKFMQALEEFQKDPEGAMQKYKGNEDVEKFLLDFCGLLGDHFTSMGDNPSQQKTQNSSQSVPGQSQMAKSLNDSKQFSNTVGATAKSPKIVDVTSELDASLDECSKPKPKESSSKSKSKIVELNADDDDDVSSPLSKVTLDGASSGSSGGGRVPDILTYTPGAGADIQEVSKAPLMADDEVREVLKDKRVMETLMDPQIMNIIQLLRTDPEKAQKIVDKATGDLKERITLLFMKGLLRFQAS
ncbi:hypothetical protein EGW08_001598 [Elysia chlorotica]|uniref:STI1 domain-containing protein n=1 Tax=Elysia chlorotica TaxID=188477 RepID=A0A3S1BKU1_ELYCH|nr:hypothetical protein EGW08_001598 [Elysia chlorotica]